MVLLLQADPGKHKDRSMRKLQQQSEIQVPAPGRPLLKVPRLPYFPLLTLSARWSAPALILRRVGGKNHRWGDICQEACTIYTRPFSIPSIIYTSQHCAAEHAVIVEMVYIQFYS